MSRFSYDQHEALHVATKHAAAKDYADMQRVEPGMFAAVRQAEVPSHDCTPAPWVCCDKKNIRPGVEL